VGKTVHHMAVAVSLAVAGTGLGGCAEADDAAISVAAGHSVAPEPVSESCSVGLILDWDGSPGAENPAAAIREILDDYEKEARALPVDAPRDRPGDLTQDSVFTAVVIRGLRAALNSLPEAEQRASRGGNIHVSAVDGSGTELANVEIALQRSGGYRVEQVRANAFPSDHFAC